ncbi:hypothetical protein OGV25_21055 [Pseudomonas sp. P1B16]|uniref:Uncharacterized protein n=2 Tax=Pseudomonas TaxID=286 RepID=A0A6G6ITD0_PSENT|nr:MULTISPECIES: hypothetical protein [Pseudomonas]KYO76853.1 hypothetical protein LT18_04940 [Pseudomonas aeruginosa]NWD82484.1 hypothetical protein [Pseudomonas reactans]NWE91164.1 hypothetical protein [Pseudomonas reactans]QIE86080.1 hypothetical protein G5B91_07295 [Pseudomonas nitroreducens]WPM25658.1 hypothetical protein OGV25_21055 [Pseudomonas sp. P1B16]
MEYERFDHNNLLALSELAFSDAGRTKLLHQSEKPRVQYLWVTSPDETYCLVSKLAVDFDFIINLLCRIK